MLRLIIVLNVLSIIGCNNIEKQKNCNEVWIAPSLPVIEDSVMYIRDKKQIEDCYIANVEYYRINPDKLEHSTAFEPESVYYHGDSLGYIKLPSTSDKNVKVKAKDLYYSPDKLKVLVFLGTKQTIKQDSIEKRDKGREYDASLLIGLRKDINKGFTLYPSKSSNEVGYSNYEVPVQILKEKMFNCFAQSKNFWGLPYRTNLGEKDFWENNLLFDKVKLSLTGEKVYFFQTYQLPTLGIEETIGNHFLYDVIDGSEKMEVEKNDKINSINFLIDPFIRKDLINGIVPKDIRELYD